MNYDKLWKQFDLESKDKEKKKRKRCSRSKNLISRGNRRERKRCSCSKIKFERLGCDDNLICKPLLPQEGSLYLFEYNFLNDSDTARRVLVLVRTLLSEWLGCDDNFDLHTLLPHASNGMSVWFCVWERVKKEIRKRKQKSGKQSSVSHRLFSSHTNWCSL